MFNEIKFKALRRHRSAVLGVPFFAVVMVLLPISAAAQCARWDANGEWYVNQRGSALITFNLQQKGRVLTGTAGQNIYDERVDYDIRVKGTVDGTIDGDSFSVQIFWKNGQTGVYNGKVLPSGRLDGEGYEKRSPNIRVPWHSEGVLKCAQAAAPSKPFKITSKITLPKTAPPPSGNKTPTIEPPASKLEPPYIIASPAKPQHLGALMGFGILTWDGGPDHPYAEVWVKVNGADETFVVEQAKGSRQVIVELGKTYLYILTDAGKTLATVGVVLQPF